MTNNLDVDLTFREKGKHARSGSACPDCSRPMTSTRTSYPYKECGLSSVRLDNILVFKCSNCGAVVPELRAIQELHFLIALEIVQKEALLSGEEIRFLRKMSGLTQRELSEFLGCAATQPAKWERADRLKPIDQAFDRLIRSRCLVGILQQMIAPECPLDKDLIERIRRLDVHDFFRRIRQNEEGSKPIALHANLQPGGQYEWVTATS